MFRVPFANSGTSISRALFYGMPLSQEGTPGCNQVEEGKASYRKTLTTISCPQDSLSSLQKCQEKRLAATVLEDE